MLQPEIKMIEDAQQTYFQSHVDILGTQQG